MESLGILRNPFLKKHIKAYYYSKCYLLVICVLLFITSVSFFTLCLWVTIDVNFGRGVDFFSNYSKYLYVILICFAALIFATLVGFYGVARNITCTVMLLFFYLSVCFALLLVGLVLIRSRSADVEAKIKERMIDTTKYYGNDSRVARVWDIVQTSLKCCGVLLNPNGLSIDVWPENEVFARARGPRVPKSCCRLPVQLKCQGPRPDEEVVYYDDCFLKARTLLRSWKNTCTFVVAAVCVVLLTGIVASWFMFTHMSKVAKIGYTLRLVPVEVTMRRIKPIYNFRFDSVDTSGSTGSSFRRWSSKKVSAGSVRGKRSKDPASA